MQLLGNLFWFLLGGMVMGLAWWLVGSMAILSIVGIPWARACFVIGRFAFFPFGMEAVSREEITLQKDIGTHWVGSIGNIIWFLLAGFWLALGHSVAALTCFISIIGIPFGIQHLKLAAIALAPIGKTIVPKEMAQAIKRANADAMVEKIQTRK